MKYSLVVFDLDGTLLDTLQDLTDSINFALKKAGLPLQSVDNVKKFIGNGIPKLVERATSPCNDKTILSSVYSDFTGYYSSHCMDKTKPFDGIPKLLDALKAMNIKIAVVSNKDDYAVKKLCEYYFGDKIDIAIGRKDGVAPKPAPDMVKKALEYLSIDKSKSVYVGDSNTDIDTADNVGIDKISVSWGYRSVEFLKERGAGIIVWEPSEILRFV